MHGLPLALLGLGDTEMMLVVGAILLLFGGGSRMPEIARGLGKVLREIRKATSDVEREFKRAMAEAEDQTVGQVRTVLKPPPETRAIAAPFTPPAKPAAPPSPPISPAPHRYQPDLGDDFHSDI